MGWRDFQNSFRMDVDHVDHVNLEFRPLRDQHPHDLKSAVNDQSPTDQTILMVKAVFPGSRVLSEAEAKELLQKLKPAEWELPQ